MVHLDPRVDGVQVPGYLAEDPVLRLNIAYGFNLPALEVDEEGVYAVLSFGGRDFGCWLPWDSVFALTLPDFDHQGALWPDDMPAELDPLFASIRHLRTEGEPVKTGASVSRLGASRPAGLSVIEGGGDEEPDEAGGPSEDEPNEPSDSTPPSGAPHLRLVKG